MEQKIPEHVKEQFKGIFISDFSGKYLVQVKFDEEISTELLSSFISGLAMFGKEAIGNIEEILIKGLGLEVFVVQNHGLILTCIFSEAMPKENIRKEAELALASFIERYATELECWDGCVDTFRDFEQMLSEQIVNYFERVSTTPEIKSPSNFWEKFRRLFTR